MKHLLLVFLLLPFAANAASFTDASGRTIKVPDHPMRVLPAGPPAAVLLAALAPDLMIGWPALPNADARALLPDQVAALPEVPRLTGEEDVTAKITPLHPDLILDYGNVTPRYKELDQHVQETTGVPTVLLDGSLAKAPGVLRRAGALLDRPGRAEQLALLSESLLASVDIGQSRRVVYARGPDGLDVAQPHSLQTEVFDLIGWTVVAPPADDNKPFHHVTYADIVALDPDVIVFEDPKMRNVVAESPDWKSLRAVILGRALIAPHLPFGWITEPPSINRLMGLAWLGSQSGTVGAIALQGLLYGRVPNPAQASNIHDTLLPIAP